MLQALLPLIPGAIKLGSDIINKPKEEDYEANTQYLERYINNLKGANRGTGERVTRPLFNKVRSQNRATGRKIQSAVGRGDLSSSEEAQLQISAGQASTGALQKVGEKAADIQTQVNLDTGKQVAGVLAQIAGIKEQSRLNFKKAQRDYKKQIGSDLLGLAGTAVMGGLGRMADTKKAYDSATASGLFEGTLDEYKQAAEGMGFGEFNQMLGKQDEIKSILTERVPGLDYESVKGIKKKSDLVMAIKEAEKEQGKVYRSFLKNGISEGDLDSDKAKLLSESQKSQLFIKSLGGDTKTMNPFVQEIATMARGDVSDKDLNNFIKEVYSSQAMTPEDARLIHSIETNRNNRIKKELADKTKPIYESGKSTGAKNTIFGAKSIFSRFERVNEFLGDGQLPQIMTEKLGSAYYDSYSPQTISDLYDAFDQTIDSFRLPEGKDEQSAFMTQLQNMASEEGWELKGKDNEDVLKSFQNKFSEKYKKELENLGESSVYVVTEDNLALIQPPEKEEVVEVEEEVGTVPSVGGEVVARPQAFDLSPNQVKKKASTLPENQQKPFEKYVQLNPSIRVLLDDVSKLSVEQLIQLGGIDVVEIKTQLSALGLVDSSKVYGKGLTGEDIEALRLIKQFNGIANPDRGILD